MKELAIGETGLVDGVLVKCVEWDELGEGCSGCVFYNDSVECGTARPCTAGKRKDKKNVKFRPIELCTWTQDADGIWYTSCGQAHEFNTGTPEENDHLYCPYCGNVLDVSRQPVV